MPRSKSDWKRTPGGYRLADGSVAFVYPSEEARDKVRIRTIPAAADPIAAAFYRNSVEPEELLAQEPTLGQTIKRVIEEHKATGVYHGDLMVMVAEVHNMDGLDFSPGGDRSQISTVANRLGRLGEIYHDREHDRYWPTKADAKASGY